MKAIKKISSGSYQIITRFAPLKNKNKTKKINWNFAVASPQRGFSSSDSRSISVGF